MNGARSWMLYGAVGHTGALIARHAQQRGHRPLLAGRTTRTSHDPAEARLAEVTAPALVMMGEQDPDYRTRGRRPTGSPAPAPADPLCEYSLGGALPRGIGSPR